MFWLNWRFGVIIFGVEGTFNFFLRSSTRKPEFQKRKKKVDLSFIWNKITYSTRISVSCKIQVPSSDLLELNTLLAFLTFTHTQPEKPRAPLEDFLPGKLNRLQLRYFSCRHTAVGFWGASVQQQGDHTKTQLSTLTLTAFRVSPHPEHEYNLIPLSHRWDWRGWVKIFSLLSHSDRLPRASRGSLAPPQPLHKLNFHSSML